MFLEVVCSIFDDTLVKGTVRVNKGLWTRLSLHSTEGPERVTKTSRSVIHRHLAIAIMGFASHSCCTCVAVHPVQEGPSSALAGKTRAFSGPKERVLHSLLSGRPRALFFNTSVGDEELIPSFRLELAMNE